MQPFSVAAVRHGRAAIVVTHDSRAFSVADRIAYTGDGQIVRTATKPEVKPTDTFDSRAQFGPHSRVIPATRGDDFHA
jgi:hypothetical protein